MEPTYPIEFLMELSLYSEMVWESMNKNNCRYTARLGCNYSGYTVFMLQGINWLLFIMKGKIKKKLSSTKVVGAIMVLLKINPLKYYVLNHHRIPHFIDQFLSYLDMDIYVLFLKKRSKSFYMYVYHFSCFIPILI